MRRLGERPSDKDLMDMIAEVDEVKIVCVAGSNTQDNETNYG